MAVTDEKLDMIISMVAHMNEEMTEQFGQVREELGQTNVRLDKVETELKTFREETAQNFNIVRGQIGAVVEALNTTIAINDAEHSELKNNAEKMERVQKQHSLDIMELRSAI